MTAFQIFLQIVIGLGTLSFLVIIHEWGHFVMARRFGVSVRSFAVGFGPALLSWRRGIGLRRGSSQSLYEERLRAQGLDPETDQLPGLGETEYRLNAVLFGGYVAMVGDEPSEKGKTRNPRSYDQAKLAARAWIAFAGPAVNIVFAVLAIWGISMIGVREPVRHGPVVAWVQDGGAGQQAGLRVGDTIVTLQGEVLREARRFEEEVALRMGASLRLMVRGPDGHDRHLVLVPDSHPEPRIRLGWAGVALGGNVVVANVVPGSAAEASGVRQGDTLVSFGGEGLAAASALPSKVKASGGDTVDLVLGSAEGRRTVQIAARMDPAENRWMVGIWPADMEATELRRYGFFPAFGRAVRECLDDATSIFRFLDALVDGDISPSNLAGPVGIVQISGRIAEEGFQKFIELLALLSINLGLLNLMPLVVTDGGRLVEFAFEAIRGRPLPRRFMEILTMVVFWGFVALALYVTFHDVLRIPLFLR